jgi:3-methyladenine DNA glycosylase/8-oxoguanine DNA glycosylase
MPAIFVPARKPFNFVSVVNSHGWRQLAPFSYDEDADMLSYVLRLSNGRVIEVKLHDGTDGVKIETQRLKKSEQNEVVDTVNWMFGLDLDFSPFYTAARGEPKLAHVKKRSLGRLLRAPTLFEDVVKTILTTNTLWAATKSMTLKLVNEFGDPLEKDPSKKAFPTPDMIAASNPDFLKEKIRVGYRAPAIHQLAVRVASGQLDLETLKTNNLPTLELRKELLTINGVGPYAAANLLMLLGRHDFIPIDSSALTVVSHEWYGGKPVTAKEIEKRFENWGEFKGLAFWFWNWAYNQ